MEMIESLVKCHSNYEQRPLQPLEGQREVYYYALIQGSARHHIAPLFS